MSYPTNDHSSNFFGGLNPLTPSYLSQLLQPKTVIDVGVAHGTPFLYEASAQARFILVEPLREFEDAIEKIAKQYRCDVFFNAISNVQGTKEITVDTKYPELSSFADRTSLTATGHELEERVIEVTTLDNIFRRIPDAEKPILLKIDVEGNELKALQGAKVLLTKTDTVILEVSVAPRFEGGYEFEDLILFMKESGFYLFAFLNIAHPKGELRSRFVDVVFKRREGKSNN